jgi:hypothetical protein
MLKMAVFGPISGANDNTATRVKPGRFSIVRAPQRKSCKNVQQT